LNLGVVFPQTEIGTDPVAIRDYAQGVDAMGYAHLTAFDHVLGASADRPGGFAGPYTHETPFHEPLVLFGYLAGLTEQIDLVTGILILPQRQTALVAKQAAQVDVLSGGRMRLGVGAGWNAVEYEGLGQDFHYRGRRLEEQVALLRALWAEPVVTFDGRFDHVTRAGINPRPVRARIPIWLGGMADVVLERVGRFADGWFPQYRDPAQLRDGIARVHRAAEAIGRDPSAIGFQASVSAAEGIPAAVTRARLWEQNGATDLSINTMRSGFTTVQEHLDAVQEFITRMRATA